MLAMVVLVNLHAADIDEFGTGSESAVKLVQRLLFGCRENGLSFHIHSIGIEGALTTGFRQTDRIEDSFRDTIFSGSGLYFSLTGACVRGQCEIRGKRCQKPAQNR